MPKFGSVFSDDRDGPTNEGGERRSGLTADEIASRLYPKPSEAWRRDEASAEAVPVEHSVAVTPTEKSSDAERDSSSLAIEFTEFVSFIRHRSEKVSTLVDLGLTSTAAKSEALSAAKFAEQLVTWPGEVRVSAYRSPKYEQIIDELTRRVREVNHIVDGQAALEFVSDIYRQASDQLASLQNDGTSSSPSVAISPSEPKEMVRMSGATSVRFSSEAYAALESLARRKRKTVAETLRDALALETWYQDTKQSGSTVLVEREGKLRELVKV